MTKNASGTDRQTLPAQADKHERWCDRAEHDRAARELGETTGCVGRRIEAREWLRGWWQQDQPGGEARFHVEVDHSDAGSWNPSLRDLQVVEDALSAAAGTPDDLLDLILTAQFEEERGVQAEADR